MTSKYAKPGEVMYHVGLTKEQLKGATYALIPGDPGRVEALAKAMGPATYLGTHREFTSWLTEIMGHPVLVMSSGMGGPCITFTVEELARLGIGELSKLMPSAGSGQSAKQAAKQAPTQAGGEKVKDSRGVEITPP